MFMMGEIICYQLWNQLAFWFQNNSFAVTYQPPWGPTSKTNSTNKSEQLEIPISEKFRFLLNKETFWVNLSLRQRTRKAHQHLVVWFQSLPLLLCLQVKLLRDAAIQALLLEVSSGYCKYVICKSLRTTVLWGIRRFCLAEKYFFRCCGRVEKVCVYSFKSREKVWIR